MSSTTRALDSQSPDLQPNKEQSASELTSSHSLDPDIELQAPGDPSDDILASKQSAFKSLGLLDRFLAVWILLAMAIGIILGNFVPNTGPALQKGKFVGVSVPIGKTAWLLGGAEIMLTFFCLTSYWIAGHDVPYLVQGQIRDTSPHFP